MSGVDDELVGRLVEQARVAGLPADRRRGLLQQLTRRVLESALEGEISDHLGYDMGDAEAKEGANHRNGSRAKTVLTDVGPVETAVPRDRDGSFTPHIVVCSTNAIESVNARVRRAVRARGHFPNEAAALKCVYLAVMSLDPTGQGRRRWTMRWKASPSTPSRDACPRAESSPQQPWTHRSFSPLGTCWRPEERTFWIVTGAVSLPAAICLGMSLIRLDLTRRWWPWPVATALLLLAGGLVLNQIP